MNAQPISVGARVTAGAYSGVVTQVDPAGIAMVALGRGQGLTHIYYPCELLQKIAADKPFSVAEVAVRQRKTEWKDTLL